MLSCHIATESSTVNTLLLIMLSCYIATESSTVNTLLLIMLSCYIATESSPLKHYYHVIMLYCYRDITTKTSLVISLHCYVAFWHHDTIENHKCSKHGTLKQHNLAHWESQMHRVGQNSMYTVYIRYSWQETNKCTVAYSVQIQLWPSQKMHKVLGMPHTAGFRMLSSDSLGPLKLSGGPHKSTHRPTHTKWQAPQFDVPRLGVDVKVVCDGFAK